MYGAIKANCTKPGIPRKACLGCLAAAEELEHKLSCFKTVA